MDSQLLSVNALSMTFNGQQLVQNLCFSIARGETLALVGESGSGKTLSALSLMKLLPEAVQLSEQSKLFFDGEDLRVFPEYLMRRVRGKKIAMIFQEPMLALNPVLSVQTQLEEVLCLHTQLPQTERQKKILDLLDAVGLAEPQLLLARYPHQLSGGMRQRVMIAMALATEPNLLIADEPTTALDVSIQAQILTLLKSLKKQFQLSMLFISHDLAVVNQIADRVAVMYQGILVEEAPVDLFFAGPNHPYTRSLLNALPSIEKRGSQLAVTEKYLQPNAQYIEVSPGTEHRVLCERTELLAASQVQTEPCPKKTIGPVLLRFSQLEKKYPLKKTMLKTHTWLHALQDVSGEIRAGETLAVVGESGSGKTTLAKALAGLHDVDSGQIEWLEGSPSDLQMIFQDPHSSMNPKWTIEQILNESLRAAKRSCDLVELLAQVGLPAEALKRYPHAFSGGQKQRIAIARALAVQPKLIICDEPTSALDVSVQAQLLNLLMSLQSRYQIAYLFISHNMSVVSYLADRIMVMEKGVVVEKGTATEVINAPKHLYTRALLESVPSLPHEKLNCTNFTEYKSSSC